MKTFALTATIVAITLSISFSFTSTARADEDHAWAITSLEHEADNARSTASKHEEMVKPYRAIEPATPESLAMIKHCERLVERYRARESMLRAEVEQHRSL